MAFEHKSGLPAAIARVNGDQSIQSLVFYGKKALLQGGEMNDVQEVIRGRHDRLGRLIAKNGDRTERALALVDVEGATVTLTEGKIYIEGDEFPVAERVITGVPMTGSVPVGVRLKIAYITGDDDPTLRGQVPGSLAENEDGAAREIATIKWSIASDGEEGDFYQVYLLQDGTILDQTTPPLLDGVSQALAIYDRPNGNYIVSGNKVRALGADSGKQRFTIEEGEANINGYKNTRYAAIRIAEEEDWDVGAVPGETQTYAGGASQTFVMDQYPIDEITSILLEKEQTFTLTRGAIANGIDGLPKTSVLEIVEVKQGATTFEGGGVSYTRTGNGVDWAGAGPEPAVGSAYTAKIRWRESVTPDSFTDTEIVVSGGATGGEVIFSYTYKLPRVDIIGLLPSGAPAYIKGVSARSNPVLPLPPSNVLALCSVHNDWLGTPEIRVDRERTGVRFPSVSELSRLANRVEDIDRLLQIERLQSAVDRRDPQAKKNMFVDPFVSDYYRDAGAEQTAAVGNRIMQLAIEPTFYDATLTEPVMLDWVEEIIVEQVLKTGCVKINEYQNFFPLPGQLVLTPAADIWNESQTQWASDATIEFQRGLQSWGGPLVESSTTTESLGGSTVALPFLRQRSIAFKIAGFFPEEILTELTFDGVDIKPAGVIAADENGEIVGSFVIPANITAGTKTVTAIGAVDGTQAEALFTGQGTLSISVMRRVTTISRWTAPVVETSSSSGGGGSDESTPSGSWSGGRYQPDPQAQIFLLPETRQLVGVNFHLCAIGNPANHVLVHQVEVDTGLPTVSLEAEAFVSMIGAVEGWKSARYNLPVTTTNDRSRAFVVKTDDGDHSISLAALGGFDAELQKPVTVHPYPVGPRLSSVNAETWTAHQNEALTFQLVAARYPVITKTVELGTFDLVDQSDLQVRAIVDLPSRACSVVFKITRTNGDVYRLLPYQVFQLAEYITETVSLSAELTGTSTLSPILYAPVELVTGKIATEGTYICRAFDISTSDRVSAYARLSLPAGSTFTMEYDLADDDFQPLPLDATEISPDPAWVEQNHRIGSLSASLMRLKLTLTGGPAARPRAAELGLGAM